MFNKNNFRIPFIKFVPVVIILFILYRLVNNIEQVLASAMNGVRFFMSVTSYFIWGFCIAYFLNPFVNFLQKYFKYKKMLSIVVVFVILIGFMTVFAVIIIPQLLSSIKDLAENIPVYSARFSVWFDQIQEDIPFSEQFDEYIYSPLSKEIDLWVKDFFKNLATSSTLEVITNTTSNITNNIFSALFGLILSAYMLYDKDKLNRSIKRILYALLKPQSVSNVIQFGSKANRIFSQFIIGKFIDSFIIAALCLIGVTILQIPFAMLISILVGVTNMIPYFGPFMGAVPSVLIVLLFDPMKALWLLIFVLILQQFDGWILGPKILGDQVGVSPLAIMAGITVGGGLFGITGMFLGVPCIALIKVLFYDEYVTKRLEQKRLDI